MEVPIQDSDHKVIDKFDHFIKSKLLELESMKNELKTLLSKLVTEYRVEGGVYQKVTYQSLYYNLKMTGEVLGIKSKDFMNLSSTPLHQKVELLRFIYL
jgi:hypothetical protein